MGEAKIANSKLILLSYINFTHLNQTFENNYLQSQNLCKLALEELSKYSYGNLHCQQTLSMIKDQLSDITVKDETIYHLSGQKLQSRNRPGLINSVSYVLN